jgi:threonine/homoserine/homoserine lactone efflux protein
MGLVTCLLNPKVAVIYLTLLPQFVDPKLGHVMGQTVTLGSIQVCIAVTGNGVFVLMADKLRDFLRTRPLWARAQRYLMGSVLIALAVRLALERRAWYCRGKQPACHAYRRPFGAQRVHTGG